MKNGADYLPRDKHDFERVTQLKNGSREEMLPLLPELLEWIQDMNWPIANEVADILLKYPFDLVPLIKKVFETDDSIWMYWCLEVLVKRLPGKIRKQLKSELIRIAENPTEEEQYEELDKIAMEILQPME